MKELLELSTKYAKKGNNLIHLSLISSNSVYACRHGDDNIFIESIVYRTAQDYDEKKTVSRQAAYVKLFASEQLCNVADMAVQIHEAWVIRVNCQSKDIIVMQE